MQSSGARRATSSELLRHFKPSRPTIVTFRESRSTSPTSTIPTVAGGRGARPDLVNPPFHGTGGYASGGVFSVPCLVTSRSYEFILADARLQVANRNRTPLPVTTDHMRITRQEPELSVCTDTDTPGRRINSYWAEGPRWVMKPTEKRRVTLEACENFRDPERS